MGPTNQVMRSFDNVVTWKIKKLLSTFPQHLWQPNLAEQGFRVEDTIPNSGERVTKCLCGHYLLNLFKAFVAIILKILILLSAVFCFLDDKLILMLSYLTFRSSPPCCSMPKMFFIHGLPTVSYHPAKSNGHRYNGSADISFLNLSGDHIIKRSRNFEGGLHPSQFTTLSSLMAVGIAEGQTYVFSFAFLLNPYKIKTRFQFPSLYFVDHIFNDYLVE